MQTVDRATGEIQPVLVPYSGDEVEQAAQRLANAHEDLLATQEKVTYWRKGLTEAKQELAQALAAWVTARAGQEAGA